MIICPTCKKTALEGSRFCDECGTKLSPDSNPESTPQYVPPEPLTDSPNFQQASVTSIEPPLIVEKIERSEETVSADPSSGVVVQDSLEIAAKDSPFAARLIIERGDAANTEFILNAMESHIGRWDADNGIFPDIDLDAFDTDAKVSRKHARIRLKDGGYTIEDLGSTNGTFINRGRRLLPGTPQALRDGDEIIVGKTFLRFKIGR